MTVGSPLCFLRRFCLRGSTLSGLDNIEITPAMVEAGVYAAREHCLGEGLEALVSKVFVAMRIEELDPERRCLVDQPSKIGHEQSTDS